MFLDKWIPLKYLIKSEICSVEYCYSDEGLILYFTHLKNKKNKLELLETGAVKEVVQIPAQIIKRKIPLILILNGKGIILKKVPNSPASETNFEEIIRQNLPALNPSEFYIQIYRQQDDSAFISLCRKEQVDSILIELQKLKFELVNLFIGSPSIVGLQPLWTNFNSLPSSLYTAEITNGNLDRLISNKDSNNEMIKLEGLQFNSNYTLGFSAGLSYLMQIKIVENNTDNLISLEKKYIEKNKLRLAVQFLIGIAFLLSIVNALFYTSFFDKNNQLETELSVYQGKYEQINELLSDYQKNKELIENAGVLNKNKLSEYADQIAKTLPDGVVLSDLLFNPLQDSNDSADSLITFQNNTIVLKGNCPKSFIVNEWLNVLKMQKFIVDVSLDKFVYNNESMLPNFQIKVLTK